MLCPVLVLYCTVLYCAILCYPVMCCNVLCCAVLCCAVLCCAALCQFPDSALAINLKAANAARLYDGKTAENGETLTLR